MSTGEHLGDERVVHEPDARARRRREREGTRRRGRGVFVPMVAVLAGILLALALFPFDGAAARLAADVRGRLGGDVIRELEAAQQFGQLGSMLTIAAAIWLLDPGRRRRLLDWLLAIGLASLVVQPMKLLIGRPRPKFGDPTALPGPFGAYPLGPEVGVRHGWEFWAGISSDLWSMPSSHTSSAVVAAVFVGLVYPRLRPLVAVLAVVVGMCRVLFGAHYPSDVAVGAGVGFAAAWFSTTRFAGVRSLDRIWRASIDRSASPAFPAVYKRERRSAGRSRSVSQAAC